MTSKPPIPAGRDLLARLVKDLDQTPPTRFAVTLESALTSVPGIDRATVWIVDLGFESLRDLGSADEIPFDRTTAGAAVLEGRTVMGESRLAVPLGRLGQIVGALEVFGERAPELEDEMTSAATVIADALISSEGHSDVFSLARGAQRLTLAATIQNGLLPLPTFADDSIEIGGHMEPAYDVAGDVFDFAANEGVTHLAIFDAVGHGLFAALLASVTIGAYRLARRRGSSLAEIGSAIDGALRDTTRDVAFVTGLLMRFDHREQVVEVCNAGHPSPLLTRDGSVESLVPATRNVPFGLGEVERSTDNWDLAPGDLLVGYTDGVLTARDQANAMLSEDVLIRVLATLGGDRAVPDMCRIVLDRVIDHCQGNLADDATVLIARTS